MVLIVAGASCYVVFAFVRGRSHRGDAGAAGLRALRDVLPVVATGLVGVIMFFALGLLALTLLWNFGNPSGGWALTPWMVGLVLVGLGLMLGLPIATIVLVVRRRRRSG